MIKLVNFVTIIMNKAFRWNITFKSKIWLLIMLLVYSHACFSFAFSYSTVCFMHAYHFFGTNGVWLRLENVFGLSCLEYGLKRKKIYIWKAHNSQSYERSVWKWTPRQSLKKATLWIWERERSLFIAGGGGTGFYVTIWFPGSVVLLMTHFSLRQSTLYGPPSSLIYSVSDD